jgi:hypothetical protein
MNIENLEELKESLFRKGFGKELNVQLEEQIKAAKPEFILEHFAKVNDDEVGYRLHFRRDEERDKVYFNSYDTALFKNADVPGEVREHNFPTDKLITAMEAYRMLKHGGLVAVNKTLFNKERQQYNTWISLDIKGQKDEYGNYPVNTFHENYFPKKLDKLFILKDELTKVSVPVKELENQQQLENIEKHLKKAFLVPVTIMINGQQSPATLSVNPKEGRIDVYDKNLQLIKSEHQDQQQKEEFKSKEAPAQSEDEVKKKSWPNQKVNWEKKSQSKGISR